MRRDYEDINYTFAFTFAGFKLVGPIMAAM